MVAGANVASGLTFAAAVLSIAIAGVSSAQTTPIAGKIRAEGNTMGGPATFRPDLDTRQSLFAYDQMLDYAKCSSGIGRKLVTQALSERPFSAAEQTQYVQMDIRLSSCKRAGLTNIHSLRRGSMAEGLYHRLKVDAAALPMLTKEAPQYATFTRGEIAFNAGRIGPDQPMIAATNCMAAEQPALVDAVLASKHGSDAEEQAMDAVFAAAPNCAGASRPTNISRSFLRAFMADSLQRYAAFSKAKAG